jgi:predicted DNA-binding transcriptional regulator AlpA
MNAVSTNFTPPARKPRKVTVHQPQVDAPPVFVNGPDVMARYRISHVTLWRWIKNAPESGFPKPTKINRFNFWLLSDLEAWEAKQEAKQKVAE